MARIKSPSLAGKVAIVTGGARGLGAGAAWGLCEGGASVMVADVIDRGEATAAELRSEAHQAEFSPLDVRDSAAWDEVVRRTVDRFGRLDILVNNAGINIPVTIEDATVEQFQTILDVNLLGAFRGMKAVIPAMKASGGGSIINISSNSTRKVVALTTVYSATKAALANLTKSASVHLGETGTNIRVNSIHPGPHETDMLVGGDQHAADIPAVRAMIDTIPLGRMGKAEEVGALVAFLASDAASYLTGGEFFIDGGVTNV